MPSQSITLLPQISQVGAFVTASPARGDGYYNLGDGLHTAVFTFQNFIGEVYLEATLAVNPQASDWFEIDSTRFQPLTALTGSQFVNFYGNFVFVRAKGNLVSGTISKIQYNH